MKKFLTILTLVTLYSFSANAHDAAPLKAKTTVKKNTEHKIIIALCRKQI